MEIEEELYGFCGIDEKKRKLNENASTSSSKSGGQIGKVVKNLHSRSSPKDVIMKSNVVEGKRVSKPKGPKGCSPVPEGWTATKALQNINRLPLSRSPPKKDNVKSNKRYENTEGQETTKLLKNHKSNHSEKNDNRSNKKEGEMDNGNVEIQRDTDKKSDGKKYVPQSLAVIKGKKYVVIKRPSVQQSTKKKPPTDNKDSKKLKPVKNTFPKSNPLPIENTNGNFCDHFLRNVSIGFEVLFHTFQYLTIKELLCCARVCRLWSLVSNHKLLWRTVRMKNSFVDNWGGFADTLRSNNTVHLDMRKMIIPYHEKMWLDFANNISTIQSLEIIDMCRCPAYVIESLFETNRKLKVLNATSISADQEISLEKLSNMQNLKELRLRGIEQLTLKNSNLDHLSSLANLTSLSLTSFTNITSDDLNFIQHLTQLESLELGDCTMLSSNFANKILPALRQLKRLRLEHGKDDCPTEEILETISTMPQLTQLELINFDLKAYLDTKLALCQNLRKLLLIPTYQQQSATTNHIILNGILKLTSLEVFTWVVTIELIRVTALYVVQYDDNSKSSKSHKRKSSTGSTGSSNSKDSYDECIPVLKPVPGGSPSEYFDPIPLLQPNNPDVMPQIEILSLEKIKNILHIGLPNTNFNIIKTLYANTWKQNLID